MNVGQNGPNAEQRYKTFGPQQVPKPIDVASAPLPGLPRGPPIASNIVTRTSDNDKPRSVPTATLTVQDQDEPRPSNIVMRPTRIETQETSEAKLVANDEVIVRDAYKEDNSIVIKWDTDTSNILGFRIVYRLFGKPEFKQGPPLAPSEREFRIKNVPSMVSKDRVIDSNAKIDISNEIFALQECIVVCVISLEEINITPSSVPYDQCREIRTEGIGAERRLDYILIPASAAIVATVIIAVIIFVACLKTSQKKRKGKVRRTLSSSTCYRRFPSADH